MADDMTTGDYEARFRAAPDRHRTGMLGLKDLRDGHSQPMTALFDGDGPLGFLTHADTRLAGATAARPGIFHCASGGHAPHACVHGALQVDRDQAVIDRFWSPEAAAWLPGGAERSARHAAALHPRRRPDMGDGQGPDHLRLPLRRRRARGQAREGGLLMAGKPPAAPEPGSPEDLGLDKDVEQDGDDAAKNIEEKGEPFDDNFA